ncbi:MAG: uracil-DNA glycosylase [Planctomycetes bacterium]|nr:uracil-DNA glycosylase [Planctomycetota bacterium]
MNRQQQAEALELMADGIRHCGKCRLCESRTHAVPGEGAADAAILVVGEGPGAREDRTGRPFVGRSGRFLDSLLAEIGLDRGSLFITSAVKCRPPGNRTPRADELRICREAWLVPQMSCIDPELVILLGLTAIRSVLDEAPSLGRVHGDIVERDGRRFLLTYHPAAGLRADDVAERLRADLAVLARV